MGNKAETAVEKFISGYNCAQSVLYSFNDVTGIDPSTSLKIASGFGAGMGRKGEVCGAVTGGILVISAKYGRGEQDDKAATEKTYSKTCELMDLFQNRNGTYICRELLDGCDLSTDEGQMFFRQNDLLNKTCKKCVKNVVQILEEIL